jgi:hypothetical protein
MCTFLGVIRLFKTRRRRRRWMEHVAPRGEKRNTYRVLMGKTE